MLACVYVNIKSSTSFVGIYLYDTQRICQKKRSLFIACLAISICEQYMYVDCGQNEAYARSLRCNHTNQMARARRMQEIKVSIGMSGAKHYVLLRSSARLLLLWWGPDPMVVRYMYKGLLYSISPTTFQHGWYVKTTQHLARNESAT